MAARLRTGDNVVVISGKDKGKTGTITRILVDEDKVIVSGLNLIKRHTRPTQQNQQGGIVTREAAMAACKVMPLDPKTGKGTRVHFGADANGKKVRVAKSGEQIPVPNTGAKAEPAAG